MWIFGILFALIILAVVVIAFYEVTHSGTAKGKETQTEDDISTTFNVACVGESSYLKNLEALCGDRTEDGIDIVTTATLIPESDNSYDKNAVVVRIDGWTVGYLNRQDAVTYRKKYKPGPGEGRSFKANIRGGWDRGETDKGHFGVFLNLPL